MIRQFLKPFGITMNVKARLVGNSYYIVSDDQFLKHQPIYIQECIAHKRKETLIPSIDFLQQIGKRAKRYVVVDAKGEWLVICGRDLAGKHITAHNNPMVGDRVVILNHHKECIGYGDILAPLSEKLVVKRLFDIGNLLRRERTKRF